MKQNVPRPPKHLSPSSRQWWRDVTEAYELEEHHLRLLTLAAESWDRAVEARLMIAEAGAFYTDRFGAPRAHPAVSVERDAQISFARLLRELALDVSLPNSSRPPAIG
jgi:phage terminase small subunit